MKSMRNLLARSIYNPFVHTRCSIQGKRKIMKDPIEHKQKAKWDNKLKSSAQDTSQQTLKEEFINRKVVDYVWLTKDYAAQVYTPEQAIQFHIDLAQPEMLNNMNGFISAKLILDMSTRKRGKFAENYKGLVKYLHLFDDGINKEVIAVCKKDDEIKAAKEAGALFAGFDEVLKMFDKGEITDASYDYIVCTNETLADVLLLKKKIRKDRLPTAKSQNVGDNIAELVEYFRLSKAFETAKLSDETGLIKINFGTLNLGIHKLVTNLETLISSVYSLKRTASNDFIKTCELYCAPSVEKFQVDVTQFIPKTFKKDGAREVDDDIDTVNEAEAIEDQKNQEEAT